MKKLTTFLFYNNAIPLAAIVLTLGSVSAFAATNPQALYNEQQQVVSIDNTYIAGVNLNKYTPKVRITNISEDSGNYYITYNFTTIALKDAVWQDVTQQQMMTVSKADLGEYRDLGVYVTQQLKQKIERELALLKETQEIEKRAVTQKQVATVYSGLIGGLLDAKTEAIPGYRPVVVAVKYPTPVEPVPEPQQEPVVQQPQPQPEPQEPPADETPTEDTTPPDTTTPGTGGQQSTLMSLQLLGDNPAHVAVGGAYHDLGVVVVNPTGTSLSYDVYVDGSLVSQLAVDTGTTSVHTIEYRAVDPEGVSLLVRRVVLVGSAADPGGEISISGNAAAPAPEPEPTSSGSGSDTSDSSGGSTQPATTTPDTTPATTSTSAATTTADNQASDSTTPAPDTSASTQTQTTSTTDTAASPPSDTASASTTSGE